MPPKDDNEDDDADQPDVGDRRSVRLASVSRPRRRLIAHLAERPDQPHSVSALAEALLPEKDKADLRSAFELQLHHVHLPALQDDGLIDYDADAKRVVSVEASALAAAVDLLESESENGDD